MFPWMSRSRIAALERTSSAAVSSIAVASSAASPTSQEAKEKRWALCTAFLEATVPMQLNDCRSRTARRRSSASVPLVCTSPTTAAAAQLPTHDPDISMKHTAIVRKPNITDFLLATLPLELQFTKPHRQCQRSQGGA
mmetsp:Transcript_81218/g.94684  ORF Transcript_81218/g.94684 Transcript_81218/m.94684 type:complete len:138 (+) Transcript_81218:70-483(+)